VSAASAYRADIDGLRAVSVVAVMAFHSGLPFCRGGFVGVDVFFVISGYLITGLLLAEHERHGRISLAGFWARRVRRLAPALLFVLAATLLLSALFLERISGEVGAVVRAALATLALNANHYFLTQSGDYFGAAAETNPLLHMWSLSGEEQFYLFWPLMLVLLLKARPAARVAWLAIFFVASLAVSTYWGAVAAPRGFYLMPSRAWELLAGAFVAFALRGHRVANVPGALAPAFGIAGLVLVVASAAALPGGSGFPGPLAAFPVAGAVLLIAAGALQGGNPASRLLGMRGMVYLGKISYPLYLWHWPLLVIARSRRLYEPSLALDLAALLA
jgi:peptidoglycan/LPS O-acetylase OafA/YrhL